MSRPIYEGARVLAMLEGRHGTKKQLSRWLKEGDDGKPCPKLSDFSIRDLGKAIFGKTQAWQNGLRRHTMGAHGGSRPLFEGELMEAGTATSTGDFVAITGQLLFNQVKDGFESEEFKFSALVPTVTSKLLDEEKIPEMGELGDVAETVLEGEEYPEIGYGSNFYTWPASIKKGFKVSLTREALFADLTGKVTEPAASGGKSMGLYKEKRLIDALIGVINNYSRNGTATDTYLTSGAYTNASVIALESEEDIDLVVQAMGETLHPDTSEPIELLKDQAQLVCVPQLERLAMRITTAEQIRQTANSVETLAPPFLKHALQVLASNLFYQRVLLTQTNATKAKTWWFLCELQKLLAWKEIWAMEMLTQGSGSNANFEKDIVLRWRFGLHGEAVSNEPRYSYRAGDAS